MKIESKNLFIFTKEELINLIEDYTNKIIENHYLNIDGVGKKTNGKVYIANEGDYFDETEISIDETSIINQLEKFKINLK